MALSSCPGRQFYQIARGYRNRDEGGEGGEYEDMIDSVVPRGCLEVSSASALDVKMTALADIILSYPASKVKLGSRAGSKRRTTTNNMTAGGGGAL